MIIKAHEAGIWLHGAAGNDYARNPIDYPAAHDEVISWGSHDKNLNRSQFSDTGRKLDLYAPGEDVLSCFGYNDYALNSGTSMAGPNGAAFLIIVRDAVERSIGRRMTYADFGLVSDHLSLLRPAT